MDKFFRARLFRPRGSPNEIRFARWFITFRGLLIYSPSKLTRTRSQARLHLGTTRKIEERGLLVSFPPRSVRSVLLVNDSSCGRYRDISCHFFSYLLYTSCYRPNKTQNWSPLLFTRQPALPANVYSVHVLESRISFDLIGFYVD